VNRVLNHPLFILLVVLCSFVEYFLSRRGKFNNFNSYEVTSNLVIISIDRILSALTGADGGALAHWIWSHRILDWNLDGFAKWSLIFLLAEFVYYWIHFYNHKVNIGWATHIVHHSPTKYNLTVGYRLGITRFFSLGWIVGLPVMLLGIHPQDLALVLGLIFFYNFFIHTELIGSLGWLDLVLNTPSNHRVHHANDPSLYNKNLGGATVLFDHLFGTFAKEEVRIKDYGIPELMKPQKFYLEIFGYWIQIFQQFGAVKGLQKKFRVLFGAPQELHVVAEGELKKYGIH
jgi:sterol desaturase/sphingolipid hydroxylase (fatty acid hydroxylase superfamily)